MERSFKEAIRHRRSYYELTAQSPVSDSEISEIIEFAVEHIPSAFNSQSSRAVLLLHEHHTVLWRIVREVMHTLLPAEAYARTEAKIDRSFASGYGTVLFYEDQAVVERLQLDFPLYADNFPVWSQQTSAMHQLAVWTMLEDAGFGASLQHYNPLIDDRIRAQWKLPDSWKLIAQMPFGLPAAGPGDKVFQPLDERVKIFG